MPYIGSSRYKYSPYLTIHFGSTERFIPGDAVIGSSTFSQLPAFRQAMALHLSFEESDTYIDHSPSNHKITVWGSGTLTFGATSASNPGMAEYSITMDIDEFFPKTNVYRPNKWDGGTQITAYGGLTAEGDWRRLFENDFTIEGYYWDGRNMYNNGGVANAVMFNIGDEAAGGGSQKRLISIDVDSNFFRIRAGQISGTEVTVLIITLSQFSLSGYFGTAYVEPYPIGSTYLPKELSPKVRGANNWRYFAIQKEGPVLTAAVTANMAFSSGRESASINLEEAGNFGALSVPSGVSTASYSVQVHVSGYNQPSQIGALQSGGIVPLMTPVSMYYDDIRITPYARYPTGIPRMGGTVGVTPAQNGNGFARPNTDHFNYEDW